MMPIPADTAALLVAILEHLAAIRSLLEVRAGAQRAALSRDV